MKKIILDKDRFEMAELFTGVGVEIGVAEGVFSSHIMKLGKVDKLYGVDPYIRHRGYRDYMRDDTYRRMQENAHLRLDTYPNYTFLRIYSVEAATKFEDNSLDFVYIDGDHSYKAVTDDITTWIQKVKPGGILAGDDYIRSIRDTKYYDVIHAVDDYARNNVIPIVYKYNGGRKPSNWLFYKP